MSVTTPTTSSSTNGSSGLSAAKLFKKSGETELLGLANEWFKDCRTARLQYERQWYLNLAFYFGRQYVQWSNNVTAADPGIMRLVEPKAPPWRVRLISNKCKPVIRKEIAKLTKQKPQPFVIPASTDDDDLAAARAGEQIFEHTTRELKFDQVQLSALFWMLLCGTAFIKDWYDPNVRDAEGVLGSIQLEAVNPFQFYIPDPQESLLENQPYAFHVLGKPADWVEDTYQKKVQPDSLAGAGLLEQRFLTAMGIQQQAKNSVAVKELWIKPCKRFAKGAKVTFTSDTILLVEEEWPFQYRDFPFTALNHIPTGQFYSDSVLIDLIPLQKEMNRTRSQIIEAKNRMSKPQLTAPRGSLDPSKITTEPGLVVFYTPGFAAPVPIPLVSLPNYVIEEVNRCQRDMDDISGQHEISKGASPTGVSAATAISFLQEQDDAMLSPTISSLERSTAQIGRHILCHVNQFWEAERTVKALGENNAFETAMFNKASIRGNMDLNVQAGSATPRSTAAKQAFIMDLMEKQYITPEQGLRYLDMAETGRMYEELQVSARQAQRENLKMSQGEEIQPHTYDEHPVHVVEHDLYRRRQAFEQLDDSTKTAFENHVQQHKQLVGQAQGTPIAPGEPLPPPPGGPPGAAPPGGPVPPDMPTGGAPPPMTQSQ